MWTTTQETSKISQTVVFKKPNTSNIVQQKYNYCEAVLSLLAN